jgi:transcriptional regulator with XRE-family HTH domain
MQRLTLGWKKGAGRDRNYYRLREWMDKKMISVSQIALDVGVGRSAVSQVLRGITNNRKVLRRLLEMGCPPDILSVPEDMKDEVKNGV